MHCKIYSMANGKLIQIWWKCLKKTEKRGNELLVLLQNPKCSQHFGWLHFKDCLEIDWKLVEGRKMRGQKWSEWWTEVQWEIRQKLTEISLKAGTAIWWEMATGKNECKKCYENWLRFERKLVETSLKFDLEKIEHNWSHIYEKKGKFVESWCNWLMLL